MSPQPKSAAPRPWVMVYDGDCSMCTRFAAMIGRWDRAQAIEIVPSSDPGLPKRFPWIKPSQYAEAMQLVGENKRTWSGAAAVEQIFEVLPRGDLFKWVFRLPYADRLSDRFYAWIARNRHHLGCGDHCPSGATSPIPPEPRSGTSRRSPRGS